MKYAQKLPPVDAIDPEGLVCDYPANLYESGRLGISQTLEEFLSWGENHRRFDRSILWRILWALADTPDQLDKAGAQDQDSLFPSSLVSHKINKT